MKKQYRIKKNEEFSRIINERKYISSFSYVLYYSKRKENYSRVGISVSKKIGNAVVRNRIKRQIRMMFHDIYNFDDSKFDIILIVKANYLKEAFNNNKNELEKTLKKVIINKY